MKIQSLIVVAVITLALPSLSFADTGTIKFKGGCKAANSGSCTIGVSGTTESVKLYAASTRNGRYGTVSNAFTAPASKRIANSVNNVCFYARGASNTHHTPIICL